MFVSGPDSFIHQRGFGEDSAVRVPLSGVIMIRAALATILAVAAGITLILTVTIASPATSSSASPQTTTTIFLPLVFSAPSCSVPPTLSGPKNGSSLNTLVPLFQWTPVLDLNATGMVLEVATDPSFSDTSLVASISFGPSSAIWTNGGTRLPGNLNPSTVYYWRVFVICGNQQGPYSAIWSLTSGPPGGTLLPPPDLSLPLNGTVVPPNSVTLQWTTVSNVIDYLVVWYPANASTSFDFAYVSGPSITIGPLLANTSYAWYVQARNDYADGTAPAQAWQFNTSSALISSQSLKTHGEIDAIGSATMRHPSSMAGAR